MNTPNKPTSSTVITPKHGLRTMASPSRVAADYTAHIHKQGRTRETGCAILGGAAGAGWGALFGLPGIAIGAGVGALLGGLGGQKLDQSAR